MRSGSISAKRIISILSAVLVILAVVFIIAGCGSSGKYKIDYGDQKDAYRNPPTSAEPGDEVKIYCIMDVLDAVMVFYVDGTRVSTDYEKDGVRVISFTMPDHDVSVEYRVEPDPAGGGA